MAVEQNQQPGFYGTGVFKPRADREQVEATSKRISNAEGQSAATSRMTRPGQSDPRSGQLSSTSGGSSSIPGAPSSLSLAQGSYNASAVNNVADTGRVKTFLSSIFKSK